MTGLVSIILVSDVQILQNTRRLSRPGDFPSGRVSLFLVATASSSKYCHSVTTYISYKIEKLEGKGKKLENIFN